jgi:hypothetical protein
MKVEGLKTRGEAEVWRQGQVGWQTEGGEVRGGLFCLLLFSSEA